MKARLAWAVLLLGGTLAAEDVTVTGYLVGAPPPALQEVVDAINVKLHRDLGVRLQINYIGWNELNSKYALVLAGGEDVDWIFTADWAPYATQAVRGAFLELTPDLLKKTMPRHWAATAAEAWKQASINGKIDMIPTATPDRKVPVALIRGDLRKKYGLPPIGSVRDLEPFLAAVKKNEPDLVPLNLGNGYDIGQPFFGVLNPDIPPVYAAFFGTIYGNYEDPRRSLINLLAPPYREAFVKAAATMKRWYDRGYINRAPFANAVLSKQSFAAGKSAVGFGNSQDILEAYTVAQARGYDPEIVPILSSTGHSNADAYTGNGVALAAGTAHPELVLRVLDLLMEDPSYARLAYFGIEGRHYVLTPDGKIDVPPNTAPGANPYPADAAGFWFIDKGVLPPQTRWTGAYERHRQALVSYLVPNSFLGFTFVPNKVRSQIAGITTVMDQYWSPLAIGAVGDVNRAVRILDAKLAEAGQDAVVTELKTQLAAFEASR
jgi:putative aldouronate transport system substrate-binding protein